MQSGIAVSPGVAVGTAYCLDKIHLLPSEKRLEEQEISAELARYETARDRVAKDLNAAENKVARELGAKEAGIFAAQHSILRDPSFTTTVRGWIVDDRMTAAAALHRLVEQYKATFDAINDPYLRDRLADVRDVSLRINAYLSDAEQEPLADLAGPLIVVAEELLPSQVLALEEIKVRGIVTQSGSQTSHAAIVARSWGIPAVSGVAGLLDQVDTGDCIVVDGREGRVFINPDPETRAAFLKLEREFFDFRDHLVENRDQLTVTSDGVELELLANVNSVADTHAAAEMGAIGVGLFRTEYLYLTHPTVPSEEEQFQEYCGVIKACPGRIVTIRSLDLGGDKTVPFLGSHYRESNPFMGWRSIRLCFEYPDLLQTQLRAVMRAAAFAQELGKQVRLMFPMITKIEEIYRVRSLVRKAYRELDAEGKHYATVPLGMMLEVPAAALAIRSMLHLVDFVSIGSNDLVQYLMAADRDNPKVAHLCQPLSPPVLTILEDVISACRESEIPLTLCGEMAGQPRSFALLLGMGLRSFSMSPAFVPYLKQFAGSLTIPIAQDLLERVRNIRTTARIHNFLTRSLRELFPDFEKFDVS